MQGQTNPNILAPKLQRRLRNAPTDAERKLWQCLRGRQIADAKFRRQHPYHRYILDFVCMEHRLVIEVDGGQHNGSAADADRDQFLIEAGFRVLRFWNHDVLLNIDGVIDVIYRALTEKDQSPTHPPRPSP